MKLRAVWFICAAGMLALAACGGKAPVTPTPAGPTATITPALLLPVALTPFGQATPGAARPASSSATARPGTIVPTPFPAFQSSGSLSATVPILMYHQIRDLPANASADDLTWTVSPASLAAQLGYLSDKGYTTISLDQLLDGFSGQSPLPPKPVVITFDDGWKTQYTNALPLLKKNGQTATFYIVSSYMGYGAYFDWTMTTDVLKAGMTIGGHTVDHKSLTGLSAVDLDHELRDSKAVLDGKLGISVTHLAYPNGAFNDTVIAAVRRAGYRTATTINPAPVKSPLVPLSLPRLRVSYKDTLADFIKKLP
jgi:peptidoglycan/xylan/chitin deacetylase (PgdA/CDA1 family)